MVQTRISDTLFNILYKTVGDIKMTINYKPSHSLDYKTASLNLPSLHQKQG